MELMQNPIHLKLMSLQHQKKPNKRKAAEKRRTVLEGEDDPNDNSLNEEEVAGPSNIITKKRKLTPYEQSREDNIQERQNLEREHNILPHSKERGLRN